jgi:hypothetical protein
MALMGTVQIQVSLLHIWNKLRRHVVVYCNHQACQEALVAGGGRYQKRGEMGEGREGGQESRCLHGAVPQ